MSKPSLEAKKAYFAATRKANYAASLRLEGFEVCKSERGNRSSSSDSPAPRARKLNA
ncbi:YhfG family protein [Pseudomonas sp. SO81]|uniref:YhfG family protein n=1 Tax=Pseudomonas sp. SO81 TaxID=2983246 RepID=UPI00338F2976|nr:hypothetical protein OH686_07980 [Pseudomonas sp. SO81]